MKYKSVINSFRELIPVLIKREVTRLYMAKLFMEQEAIKTHKPMNKANAQPS